MGAPKISVIFFLLSVSSALFSCEKKCDEALCTDDQDLQILLVDDSNNNLVVNGSIEQDKINLISTGKDTIQGVMNREEGSIIIQTYRDLGQYTLSVGTTANVDILVYQNYIATDFECCPGYWKIDSVYARGTKLAQSPDGQGFLLKVD